MKPNYFIIGSKNKIMNWLLFDYSLLAQYMGMSALYYAL